jgi:hypothetical protein
MLFTSLSIMGGYMGEQLQWCLMNLGSSRYWFSDCAGNSVCCRIPYLAWKSITPSSHSRGLWWVLKG